MTNRILRFRVPAFAATCAASGALVAAQGIAYGLHHLPEEARILGFLSFAGWLVATFMSALRIELKAVALIRRGLKRSRPLNASHRARLKYSLKPTGVAAISLVLYLAAAALIVIPPDGAVGDGIMNNDLLSVGTTPDTIAITWAAEDGVSNESPENSEIRELGARVSFAIVDPGDPTCRTIADRTWSVRNLDQPNARYTLAPTGPCTAAASLTKNDHFRVRVTGARPDGLSVTGQEEFRLKELVIVSLGDSVASGEGNPNPQPPLWRDNQNCHRSLSAGPRRAAELLQRAHLHLVVAFVHFACTGAWIDGGPDPPRFLGRHPSLLPVHPPDRGRGLPEIDRLDALLGRGHHIDMVFLSIGANDIGFSQILKFCAFWPSCFKHRFHGMSLDAFVDRRLQVLASSFRSLAAQYPFNGATPVYVTEYFDPLRDGPNAFCRIPPQLGFISRSESEWAEKTVLEPLNALLQRVVRNEHWNLVPGIHDAFAWHGYCAKRHWIVTVPLRRPDQWLRDWKGYFHPNLAGQKLYGRKIFAAVQKRLRATSAEGG